MDEEAKKKRKYRSSGVSMPVFFLIFSVPIVLILAVTLRVSILGLTRPVLNYWFQSDLDKDSIFTFSDNIEVSYGSVGNLTVSGFVSFTNSSENAISDQGVPVSSTTPVNGDTLFFSGLEWIPESELNPNGVMQTKCKVYFIN
jgi:hypothetical protein